MGKSTSAEIYERLRREVATLAKLRHPALVKLIEPLEESKNTMRFVTEQLTASLQHLIDINSSSVGSSTLENGELDEIVIQKGLLRVVEALEFVQGAAGYVHLDVQPASVLVNVKGDWKLSGLGFVEDLKNRVNGTDFFLPRLDPRLPSFVQVNLDYAAPELVLDHKLDMANDMFSLGCLLISLFTFSPPMNTENSSNMYKGEFSRINRALRDERIPAYLSDMIKNLVTRSPAERMTLEQIKTSALFDNVLIRTINFLDDFATKNVSEQQTFMTGFPNIIDQFPKSVLQKKILPTLLEELGKEDSLTESILNTILHVGKDMSQLGFSEKILPSIKKVKEKLGAQIAVLTHLETLKSRLTKSDFNDYILPIFLKTLSTAPPDTQALALQRLPLLLGDLDFMTLKTTIFPVISDVFSQTTDLTVKLESLNGFQHLLKRGLDKSTITTKLLPLLQSMKTRDARVALAALSVYESIADTNEADVDTLAAMVPLVLGLGLEAKTDRQGFNKFVEVVTKTVERIGSEHGKKLDKEGPSISSAKTPYKSGTDSKAPGDKFENLLYGNKSLNNSNTNISSNNSGSSITASSSPITSAAQSQSGTNPVGSFGALKLEPQIKRPNWATSSSSPGPGVMKPLSPSFGQTSNQSSQSTLQPLQAQNSWSTPTQPIAPSTQPSWSTPIQPTTQNTSAWSQTLQPSTTSWSQPLQASTTNSWSTPIQPATSGNSWSTPMQPALSQTNTWSTPMQPIQSQSQQQKYHINLNKSTSMSNSSSNGGNEESLI